MSLAKILEEELLSEDLVKINRSEIIDLINNHVKMLIWCARQDDLRDVCREYLNVTRRTLRSLAMIRFIKAIQEGEDGGDESLQILNYLRDSYMRYLYNIPIDPMDRVPVKINVEIRFRDRKLLSDRVYLLPIDLAIRLVISGLAQFIELKDLI